MYYLYCKIEEYDERALVENLTALQEEKERSCMFADELAKMEVKFKAQLKTNENMKLQLAAEEDRYKVSPDT